MEGRLASWDDVYHPNPNHDHDRIVIASRMMDRLVVQKIRANPGLMDHARENLRRSIELEKKHRKVRSDVLLEWERIFKTCSDTEILDVLLGETQYCDWLRSSAPFSGLLTEEERRSILSDVSLMKKT